MKLDFIVAKHMGDTLQDRECIFEIELIVFVVRVVAAYLSQAPFFWDRHT